MFLYKIINILLTPFTLILLIYRVLKGKEDKKRFLEKLGITKAKRAKNIKLLWFHAASIGESLSVLPIVKKLSENKDIQILFTSGTLGSAEVLKQKLPKNVVHQYAPIENFFVVKKFLKHWNPSIAIFVESEFWPLLLSYTKQYCKIISLNSSISDTSVKYWNKFKKLKNHVLSNISIYIPKSTQDEGKLRSLGAKNIKYLGNIKYCAPPLEYDHKKFKTLKDQIKNRNIVLFASTHTQEEHVVFEIYYQLKKISKHDFIFIIAPRHPKKLDNLKSILTNQKIDYVLHSSKKSITDKTQFYIVDTLGELGTFFKLSPITVMGGTFEKIGGHNIIEPSKFGSIVINGPHDYSIAEMSQEFTDKDALLKVNNAQECSLIINSIFITPLKYQKYTENAIKLIKEKQSIINKAIKIIQNEI